ncbi:MAG: C-terminal binding protein [Kiritimatiellia bacterium]|nr:C-terminal binding protein [Kiritimatiellia bacterium]
MNKKVVILDDRHQHYQEETDVLKSLDIKPDIVKNVNPDEIGKICADAGGIIVNLAPINAEVISALQKCKIISRYGVGYDNVAVAEATAKKIWVANVPDYCAEDVSDQAFALFLSCVRKVALRDRQLRTGIWKTQADGPQWRIKGKTFVFFGFGQIARIFHRKLAGFQLGRVLVYDPFLDEASIRSAGAEKVDWETAIREGDFFSIHMPLNDKTRGLFNEAVFKKMKKTAIIINTSRGPIIDERALDQALAERWINSAGLDVFETEPIKPDNPLLKLDNITVSGHSGWYTEEAQSELKRKAAENVRDVLAGGKPKYAVNMI